MISIIIPIYNSKKYISRCINSILDQTYKDYEIILINDGSTDDSLSVLYSIKESNPTVNIRIIDKLNEGCAKTRNLGIKEAIGDYVTFIDNDDYLDEDYLEKFSSVQGNPDIVIGGYKRVSDDKTLFRIDAKDSEWTKYVITAPWARIFKRSFLIDNDIEFFDNNIGEDVLFNMKAYKYAKNIKVLNYTGYNWYYNDQSVSNTVQRGFYTHDGMMSLINHIYDLYQNDMNQYICYFFNRYIVWYLLFAGRDASKKEFVEESKQLYTWLKERNIKHHFHFYSSEINADTLQTRLSVSIYNIIHKLNLDRLFALIYCKGK